LVLSLFNNNAATKPPGVMLPIPLFPVFSATVTEYGMYPVVALCFNPAYLQSPSFPSDAKQRAMTILENCLGGRTGPYTDCPGMPIVRQQVAKFIQNRDGVPASFEDIILSNGATDALRVCPFFSQYGVCVTIVFFMKDSGT
ncbi:alanine aminotransferase 1-like, partial [Stegodyphus dumicola]|uniref:alanine aminotransferase 1-like n=1 Tax=Stegodyphus dumicola TaxID=202533 RepID=UPI0015B1B0CA